MKSCPAQFIIDEVARQGGRLQLAGGAIRFSLPGDLQNDSWAALLKQEKPRLVECLGSGAIDREDYEVHVRHFNKQEELINA